MITTLNKIREHSPCSDGWQKLLKHLGKTQADDEPLLISTIVESNGIDDALWCLQAVDGCDKEVRLFAVWCARRVQHLMKDRISVDSLDVAERYAHGKATKEELEAAKAAAWNATSYAARLAAWEAAKAAAWNATSYAAWEAASYAAWEAAKAAALSATSYAAWEAARDAQKQELLRVCMEWEAARDAARDAA